MAAARELVADVGHDVALDEVARRAGVGNATLYRHFSTRAELLAVLYTDEVDELCRYGTELLDAASPVDGLFTWLEAFAAHVATKRPLALAATDAPDGRRTPMFAAWHDAITTTATDLTRRARPHLHPEVTVSDLLALTTGIALAAAPTETHRLTALLRTGLLAPPF